MIKNKLFLFVASLLLLTTPVTALAAAPDGVGPWADTVVSTTQGLRKDGTAVLASRSDPTSALGVAENNTVDGNFYSLGFGGVLTLGFENGISNGAFVIEATNNPYPDEMAQVEVSEDGATWYPAGVVTEDDSVALPNEISCGKFIRITDISNMNLYESTADGYDVDGVQAQGDACSLGKMTGGGSVFTTAGARVTHGFQLACSVSDPTNNLQINWGKGNKFHLESLTSVLCTDNPGFDPGNPTATFDTHHGMGTGRFNGVSGHTVEWIFTDQGEPGKSDTANIVIKDPSNAVVLSVSGNLKNGNQQAH